MSISRLTAMTIGNPDNDVRIEVFENRNQDGFNLCISLFKNDEYHTLLLSSRKDYASEEEAKAAGETVIRDIKEWYQKEIN